MKTTLSNLPINKWPRPLRHFVIVFLLLLTSGVSVGLIFLFSLTSFTAQGTVEHYKGSTVTPDAQIDVPEKYAKPVSEMLITTHNHLIGFSFIFFILCGLFYFNSTITGRLKNFFLIEPFVSAWLTFAAIWAVRYIDANFIFLTIAAGTLTYISYYFILIILVYELGFKKSQS
jgi:hypothetical protein